MKIIMILIYLTKSDILGSVSDKEYYFKTDELYFIVENDFFKFETSNEQTTPQLFKEHYIHENTEIKLSILLTTNQRGKLIYVSKNSQQNNLTIKITNLNVKSSSLDVIFLQEKKETKEPDFITFYTSSTNFFTFSNHESKINYRVIYSKDDEIITQVLNTEERRKVIVCYGGKECSKTKEFSINWEENYLTGINESTIEGKLKEFIPSGGIESMRIYFDIHNPITPTIDFSSIPLESIEKVELIGRPGQTPQIIKIINHEQAEIKSKLTTRNIQFFDEKRLIQNQNTKNSPQESASLLSQVIYPIDPKFSEKPEIEFMIGPEALTIDEETVLSFTYGRENIYRIRNVVNTGSQPNTILIKPEPEIFYFAIDIISILVENCDPISIQFSGWEEEENKDFPEIMFHFYSENESDLIIKSSKNRKVKYRHLSYRNSSLVFYEYPSAFVFCISTKVCDRQEFDYLDPIQVEIAKENISLIEKEFDDITKVFIRKLVLCMNNNSDGIEFSFPYLKGENLNNIQFINHDEDNITIKIKDFRTIQDNSWELTNCTVDVIFDDYTINELFSNNALIRGDNLKIKHGTFIKNVDLLDDDINFTISESNYWFELNDYKYKETDNLTLKIKARKNSTNKIRFETDSKNPCGVNLNFEGVDENSTEFLLFLENDWSDIENINNKQILINVSSIDHIPINRIPRNIDFVVYSKELGRNIQQVYSNSTNFVFCYESNECVKQTEFSIDNDTNFISTKTKDNYDEIIESIHKIDKNYNYLKYVFFDTEKVIKFNLSQIPSEKFDQLQLYGWNENYSQLLLNDEAKTSGFDFWLIRHVSFAENLNIKYTFKEITIIDTDPIFQNVIKYSNNINIGTAKLHCRYNQKINGLKNVFSINFTTYELFPEIDTNDFILSIKGLSFNAYSNLENGNGNPIIQPIQNKFNFIVHAPPNPINSTFYICRFDNDFNDISIHFENFDEKIRINYVCKSKECNKPFNYNFTIDDIYLIKVYENECNNTNTILNGNNTYPLATFLFSESSQFSESNLFTFSSIFSKSIEFTETYQFSESFKFSDSSQFSTSSQFSMSSQFSETGFFSETSQFSATDLFSISSSFTDSKPFTKSSMFSPSRTFTPSLMFSSSSMFSQSLLFTQSIFDGTRKFTLSHMFSQSSLFSETSEFTQSFQFTPSFPIQFGVPDSDQISQSLIVGSSLFIMTSVGFINEKNVLSDLSHFNGPLTTIFFTSRNIKITEDAKFSLSTTLYFSANETGSTILIDRNLYKTVIGVKTDNSPTIILTNTESPLNIMNYKHGYSKIDILYQNETNNGADVDLTLNELNNSNGYLTINVELNIRSVSFKSLLMSRISSLEIKHKNFSMIHRSSDSRLLAAESNDDYDEDDEDAVDDERAEIIVEDRVDINRQSTVILSKANIKGELNIYEDSLLILKDGTVFSNQSRINFIFHNSKHSKQKPIVKIDSFLNSTPSEIIFTFEGKSKSSDVSNLVLLEATDFKSCLSWVDNAQFPSGDKRRFGIKCKYAEGGSTEFVFNAKNKLSKGAIIGIAVACIVVVAVIVIIVVIVVIKKKKSKPNHSSSELDNTEIKI